MDWFLCHKDFRHKRISEVLIRMSKDFVKKTEAKLKALVRVVPYIVLAK